MPALARFDPFRDISASFDRGVLEVRVPEAEDVTPRKISVTAGSAA